MKRMGVLVCLVIWLAAAGTAKADGVYAETPLASASEEQLNNIRLAAEAIDDTRLAFGEMFSFNATVGERAEERGYLPALNGRGVTVTGGGVAQAATTLYLALMQRDDIEYSSIYTYNENFSGGYVDSGYDAIVTDYYNHVDFEFSSCYEGALVVYMWMDEESLCCYVAEDTAEAETYAGENGDGFAQTPVYADEMQLNNIELSAASIDGYCLEPGETFSFNHTVGPRTEERGYQMAVNGRGVRVVGGGTAQVAATMYLAARDMDGVEIVEAEFYGDRFAGYYVESGEEAVLVDWGSGIDFSFVNTSELSMSIYTYVDEENSRLICEICEGE